MCFNGLGVVRAGAGVVHLVVKLGPGTPYCAGKPVLSAVEFSLIVVYCVGLAGNFKRCTKLFVKPLVKPPENVFVKLFVKPFVKPFDKLFVGHLKQLTVL